MRYFAAGLDLASVNAGLVGLPADGLPLEAAITAAPKEELRSPKRDLDMAARIGHALADQLEAVGLLADEHTVRILCVEHTPFMAKQAGAAMTGVVRGALYTMLQSIPLLSYVYLVNPSQWRSFHGIVATGSAKQSAYAAAAEALGFVSRIDRPTKRERDKARSDVTAAFLIAKFAEAIALSPTDPRVATVVDNPNNRIVPT